MDVVAFEDTSMGVGLVQGIAHIVWSMGVVEACFHKCFLSIPIAKDGSVTFDYSIVSKAFEDSIDHNY